jgi:putative phosphoesterase
VRLAVVSDIHGNLRALESVARDLKFQSPDVVVHGGDLAVIGPRPREVLDFVRAAGWQGVLGNTDQMLFDTSGRAELEARSPGIHKWLQVLFDELAPWASEQISPEQVDWLKGLPTEWRSNGMVLVHAAPNDLWRAPMPDAADQELLRVYGGLDARLVVYGHIHRPYMRPVGGFVVANTGSVGLPYDGDLRASYLLIDKLVPAVRRVEYDLDRAASDGLASGFPFASWLAEVVREARFRTP